MGRSPAACQFGQIGPLLGDLCARPLRLRRPRGNDLQGRRRLRKDPSTIYLCDYLGNETFQTAILKLLNQGESVHFMEPAIHNGDVGPKRGRTEDQLAAISGALSLVANILMAWNTVHIESARAEEPEILTDEIVSKVAPVAHGHINLRGIFKFDLAGHRTTLLEPSQNTAPRRVKPGS